MISNAKQLASLTAAGTAALLLTSGTAEAGIIYSGVLDTTVGFHLDTVGGGQSSSHIFNTFAAAGGPSFRATAKSEHGSTIRKVSVREVNTRIKFGATHNFYHVQLFGTGAQWVAGQRSCFSCHLDARGFGAHPFDSQAPYTDKYFLFRFAVTAGFDYGWVEASLSDTTISSPDAIYGPTAVIESYAFDNTPGELIHTGDTGIAPEPSTSVTLGLAALILGAEGLRRMRKARSARQ